MPTVSRPDVFGFLVGQQLQQPIVLNLISRRITLRLSYQPPVVCKVLVVDVTVHCDLQGVHWRIAGCAPAAALSSVFRQRITGHPDRNGFKLPYDATFRSAH
jgi:hypothetical protein